MKSDFSGYVTKNDVRCSDGRTIRRDAFAECDGKYVPLVFQHEHRDIGNVLGKVLLENRPDGVYGYGFFNDSENACNAKKAVAHGDITAMSIYANHLRQNGGDVLHGEIKEVSLVLAGANPGALIDNVTIEHSDGSGYEELPDQAVIFMNDELFHGEECSISTDPESESEETDDSVDPDESDKDQEATEDVAHADKGASNDKSSDKSDKTNVLDDIGLTDEQKDVVYGIIGMVLDENSGKEDSKDDESDNQSDKKDSVEHSAEEGDDMNIFEKGANGETVTANELSHEDQKAFMTAAAMDPSGSFRNYALRHSQDYGITDIETFFPDAKAVSQEPDMYKRDTLWVSDVLGNTHHLPFSRIKSWYIDLTADEARAKGFTLDRNSNKRKTDEVIKAAKRVTTPTTVYKKQKLDRDDVLDITDFNVVNLLMREMRVMLDEEVARAVLIGDGRDSGSDDHINEESIRPIVSDDDLYVIRSTGDWTTTEETATELVDRIRQSKVGYMGSGELRAYMTPTLHAKLMVQRDQIGRRLYSTDAELAAELGVSSIVEVPIMENFKDEDEKIVDAILVNPRDYDMGSDKGGEVNNFNDFDIDYNQHKYLMETRLSGALVRPKSAIVIRHTPKA